MDAKNNAFSTPLAGESVVTRIVRHITDSIISGNLKPGEKLPTEPDLCASFQVGRNSVREAIKILEAYGVVYIKRAEGTFINDTYTQKMLDPMLYGILLQKDFASDIIQLRKVLDIGIFHTIMHTITEEHLKIIKQRLEQLIVLLSNPVKNIQQIFDADVAFHKAITDSAQNELLFSMYSYVDRITTPSREHAMQIILETEETEEFIELHKKIVTIIEEKNFSEIEQVLTSHYKFWKQVM